jgi:hypothetical protein
MFPTAESLLESNVLGPFVRTVYWSNDVPLKIICRVRQSSDTLNDICLSYSYVPWVMIILRYDLRELVVVQKMGLLVTNYDGCAIAQADSRRLLTAATLVPNQIRSCKICGGQSGGGVGFLRVFRLLLQILIPLTAPHSSSITQCSYNRPITSGLSLTPPEGGSQLKLRVVMLPRLKYQRRTRMEVSVQNYVDVSDGWKSQVNGENMKEIISLQMW